MHDIDHLVLDLYPKAETRLADLRWFFVLLELRDRGRDPRGSALASGEALVIIIPLSIE